MNNDVPQPRASPSTSKPKVVIAGNSMLKFINDRKILQNHITQVKCSSGATVDNMSDYIKPTLRHNPNEIILHVGTNNVKLETPHIIGHKSWQRNRG